MQELSVRPLGLARVHDPKLTFFIQPLSTEGIENEAFVAASFAKLFGDAVAEGLLPRKDSVMANGFLKFILSPTR